MEISEAQYQHIASSLPRQRGNVKLLNLQLLNALLYVAEHGCKWRGAGSGLRAVATRADRAHPHRGREPGFHHRQSPSCRHRHVKKNGPQAIGKSRGGWTTKIHMVAADARTAITFALSPGQASDAVEGRKLLGGIGPLSAPRESGELRVSHAESIGHRGEAKAALSGLAAQRRSNQPQTHAT